jgi:23S rRNA (cytidine1920-2'-O)/16S rRNA (cytidine1409-2'-O)-methyltransferase
MARARLDDEVVRRGLADTIERARQLIRAGEVLVDEVPADKPGALVREGRAIRLRSAPSRYVSRGGLKLEAALDAWGVDPAGRVCVDLGASTGGFTDCLLQRGATRVYAIDVGYGQLAWKLRQDPRVVPMERTNVRAVDRLPETPSLLVGDLSFISLRTILPSARRLLADDGEAVLLVKPQFEVAPEEVGPRGRVVDETARERALAEVSDAARACGFSVRGTMPSPVPGARAGNVEWLLHLRSVVG